jgi:chorismate synthase
MTPLTYHTAGESHGPALVVMLNGMPARVPLDLDLINGELKRRQGGYGRGGRQKIETDAVTFLGGVRLYPDGVRRSIGAPIALSIPNRDNRLDDPSKTPPLAQPRPGHADLAGSIKWLTTDCRETLERASARETASRVAAGAIARCLLLQFGIEVVGFVREVGPARATIPLVDDFNAHRFAGSFAPVVHELRRLRDDDDVYCPDHATSAQMRDFIQQMKQNKDTAGGVVECHVFGCPVGLGSSMNGFERLDGRIAQAVMSIQAFKGVEIGLGFETARRAGSQVHDEIFFDESLKPLPVLGYARGSNNAGGLEGGMTNGMPVVVRGAMKPISTLGKPLRSVDLNTKQPTEAGWERSDISAISAASVVMENVVAFEIARALLEKFGGDSLEELRVNHDQFLATARRLPL